MSEQTPTILVLFGATGDLVTRKIIPSLISLMKNHKLPKSLVIMGFARRPFSDADYRSYVDALISEGLHLTPEEKVKFLNLFQYVSGNFEHKDAYVNLKAKINEMEKQWGVCSNKLLYLAVAPDYYSTIFEGIYENGLANPCALGGELPKILVEKPFGTDAKTAAELEVLLTRYFREEQIYRIDHYLAKEVLQNILVFRFANNLFEESWNRDFIEKIEIVLWEMTGVEKRGAFYDKVGALRDVGQNHLLQVVALIAMDHPKSFETGAIHKSRASILNTLQIPTEEEAARVSFRAQHEGYTEIPGVAPSSETETFFQLSVSLNHPRWRGVPFVLEAGKRMSEERCDVIVTFKHLTPCLCPEGTKEHYKNKVIFELEPERRIMLKFWNKMPGFDFKAEYKELILKWPEDAEEVKAQYTAEYQKLLLDAIAGDQTLFITASEVKSMWEVTDPFVEAWRKNAVPLKIYEQNKPFDVKNTTVVSRKENNAPIKKEIAIIGIGKMGSGIAHQLLDKGWQVIAWNKSEKPILNELKARGAYVTHELRDCIAKLSSPKIVWLMLPAGVAVDDILFKEDGLVSLLKQGDSVVDGGNSLYKDTIRRHKLCKEKGIHYIDVGISGGPNGARHGACLMIGGEAEIARIIEPICRDISIFEGYEFFDSPGAGHFVKMVHNGIEYGMMQAIAEGFAVLKQGPYKLNLTSIADLYNRGSVIESRLVGWLAKGFRAYSEELQNISGSVKHTGEGAWTVEVAKEFGIPVKIIEESFKFRIDSEHNPTYIGQILTTLRNQFGGHSTSSE